MAKIKLVHFEILSLLDESKKLVEYLQKTGVTQFEDVDDESLLKYQTLPIVQQFDSKRKEAEACYRVLEKYCELKKSFLESFNDCEEIEYSEYRLLADRADKLLDECGRIIELDKKIAALKSEIASNEALIAYYKPWIGLDIPMASKRTLTTNIFIGTFQREISKEEIFDIVKNYDEELDDVEIQIVSSQKMLTCVVAMCHQSSGEKLITALKNNGFVVPEKIAPKLPEKAIEECEEKILSLNGEINSVIEEIKSFSENYREIRFLSDYYTAQMDKYSAVENAATSKSVFCVKGYIPERAAEEVKFEVERQFTAQMELTEPDYEGEDVPVLIENKSFGAGVESITDMYSPVSNKDIDPNPIMAFFYYAFFGLMLSDAGYGILMIIFAIFAKKKLKIKGSLGKSVNMVFYSGISTVFWGALFGGWFGDLIPIVATEFLGFEKGPNLAIWMDPVSNSMELLLFCLGFGIVQLFTGLLIRFYMLCKERQILAAVCDTIPVMLFVTGFAILGAGLITDIPENISKFGAPFLAVGAVLIVLTAGRSSKNILGKLGGGLYALYNYTTGYIGDILSYSRLLALSLVTGVVASAINMLAAMPGNIIIFVVIFLVGHTVNIAINLIGTYVHTNRLQFVEFFSKFYEGSGRVFTPFRINSKFFKIKEENIYE